MLRCVLGGPATLIRHSGCSLHHCTMLKVGSVETCWCSEAWRGAWRELVLCSRCGYNTVCSESCSTSAFLPLCTQGQRGGFTTNTGSSDTTENDTSFLKCIKPFSFEARAKINRPAIPCTAPRPPFLILFPVHLSLFPPAQQQHNGSDSAQKLKRFMPRKKLSDILQSTRNTR